MMVLPGEGLELRNIFRPLKVLHAPNVYSGFYVEVLSLAAEQQPIGSKK